MREMKDSGVEWIEQIPTEWDVFRGKSILRYMKRPPLDEDEVVTCFRDGVVTLRKNRREDGFTFSEKEIGYQHICAGDIVIHGMDGFAGAIGLSDSDGKGSPVLVVCETEQNSNYIMYYLRMLAQQSVFIALATGIRERSCDLRWNKIAELLFPIPSIKDQKRLSAYLDTKCAQIDAVIARQQEIIEKLKAYKLSVITETVTKGLNPDVPMKESGVEWIGKIPESWSVKPFGKCTSLIQTGPFGSQLHAEDYTDDGIILINPANIKDGQIVPDSKCSLTQAKANELSQHILDKGNIVFARRGEMGRCALITDNEKVYFCGTGCMKICTDSNMIPEYTIYFMQLPLVKQYLGLHSVGTTMANLNASIISNIPIICPPLKVQYEIAQCLAQQTAQLDSIIELKQTIITKLTEYKKSLIYEVVTGKKEV